MRRGAGTSVLRTPSRVDIRLPADARLPGGCPCPRLKKVFLADARRGIFPKTTSSNRRRAVNCPDLMHDGAYDGRDARTSVAGGSDPGEELVDCVSAHLGRAQCHLAARFLVRTSRDARVGIGSGWRYRSPRSNLRGAGICPDAHRPQPPFAAELRSLPARTAPGRLGPPRTSPGSVPTDDYGDHIRDRTICVVDAVGLTDNPHA
jgi:hypothetical protein